MSTTTTAPQAQQAPDVALARSVALAMQAADWTTVLTLATRGKVDFPDMAPFGVPWDKMIAKAEQVLDTNVADGTAPKDAPEQAIEPVKPVRQPKKAPVKKAAPEQAVTTPAVQEQDSAQPTPDQASPLTLYVLQLAHTVADGTRLLGSPDGEIGKKVSTVMGRNGARWAFHLRDGYWYVPGSMGKGADQVRMYNAMTGLEAAGFPVEWAVDDTDPATGETLPAHVAKAERARRDAAYIERLTAIRWHLANSAGLPCGECTAMLGADAAQVVYEPRAELPVVVCEAHVDGREQAPESIVAEPEPVAVAVAEDPTVQANALIVALMGGDAAAGEALMALVAAQSAKPAVRRTPKVAAPKVAAPKVAEPLMGPQEIELWFAVGALPGGEQARVRQTAAALRSGLTWAVANKHRRTGFESHVYADRSARRLQVRVTVTAVTEPVWAKIQAEVAATALRVAGVVEVDDAA